VGNQDISGILNFINARAAFALSQLPTATAFAITSNAGNNFGTSNSTVTIAGTAPISVKDIQVNGLLYPITWTSSTAWTISVPLFAGTNLLNIRGIDNRANILSNAFDTVTVTNTGPGALARIVINEWMADNKAPGGFPDPADGAFQDWFELFNPNTAEVNLSGYYLTDNLSQPAKWRIPTNTIIAPRDFLVVWADGQTTQNFGVPGTQLHASFQLNNGGEAIGLYAPDGLTAQWTVDFGSQFENASQGFYPDGNTNALYFMTDFSPGAPNRLPAPMRITAISLADGIITLTWTSTPGRTYRLEFKNDLADPEWTLLQEVPATALKTSTTDFFIFGTTRFYHIRELE
jgi:hypothetical protein